MRRLLLAFLCATLAFPVAAADQRWVFVDSADGGSHDSGHGATYFDRSVARYGNMIVVLIETRYPKPRRADSISKLSEEVEIDCIDWRRRISKGALFFANGRRGVVVEDPEYLDIEVGTMFDVLASMVCSPNK